MRSLNPANIREGQSIQRYFGPHMWTRALPTDFSHFILDDRDVERTIGSCPCNTDLAGHMSDEMSIEVTIVENDAIRGTFELGGAVAKGNRQNLWEGLQRQCQGVIRSTLFEIRDTLAVVPADVGHRYAEIVLEDDQRLFTRLFRFHPFKDAISGIMRSSQGSALSEALQDIQQTLLHAKQVADDSKEPAVVLFYCVAGHVALMCGPNHLTVPRAAFGLRIWWKYCYDFEGRPHVESLTQVEQKTRAPLAAALEWAEEQGCLADVDKMRAKIPNEGETFVV